MKKCFFILVLIFLVSLGYTKTKKENDEKKMSEIVAISGKISAKTEIGLADSNDDSDEVNVTIAKNKPVFTTEADVFAKLLIFKHENIIFGPTAYTMLEGKMDHRDMVTKVKSDGTGKTKNIFFFETQPVTADHLYYFDINLYIFSS